MHPKFSNFCRTNQQNCTCDHFAAGVSDTFQYLVDEIPRARAPSLDRNVVHPSPDMERRLVRGGTPARRRQSTSATVTRGIAIDTRALDVPGKMRSSAHPRAAAAK